MNGLFDGIPAPAPAPAPSSRPRVWGVYELVHAARLALESHWGETWVEGEILELKRPTSGHLYFTLKDAQGRLPCVMYRSAAAGLRLALRDGMLVRALGRLTVYEAGGRMQLQVSRLQAAGEGALLAQLEALKKRLAAEGLFALERKRPIPPYPSHVGVVTSPTGAAIRDILEVLRRRFANLHVVLAPARVQGEGAAAEIAAAIRLLNARGGLDVMIVGRGGGSLEDLWCFNEEIVARAIAASRIPVISAVGHETDTTLADYAADLRAPTPSAAAELVVKAKDELLEKLAAWQRRLLLVARQEVLQARRRLERAAAVPSLADPRRGLERRAQALDLLSMRLQRAVSGLPQVARSRLDGLRRSLGASLDASVRAARANLDRQRARLAGRPENALSLARSRLAAAAKLLGALNPLAVLSRGYTMTCRADGRPLRSPLDLVPGDILTTRWADGTAVSAVQRVQPTESTP